MDRREFLQMLGLFSGTTLLSSCGSEQGQNELISYLVPPEDGVVPGEARWVVSTCTECPAGCGLQARVREGWPVKLEGIAGHPVSAGGLCVRGQASLWRLYHPERLRTPMRRQADGSFAAISWDQAFALILDALASGREQGRPSYYLAGRTTGSLSGLIDRFCLELGAERLPEFELIGHSALRRANGLLYGRQELPHVDFSSADLLLTFGADLFETFVSPVDFAHQFGRATGRSDFRWFHLEPHLSLTGANAHRRLVLRPGSEAVVLAYLLRRLMNEERFRTRLPAEVREALPAVAAEAAAPASGLSLEALDQLGRALASAKAPVVVAGGVGTAQPAGLAATVLGGLLQWTLGLGENRVDFGRAENYAGVGSLLDLERFAGRLAAEGAGVVIVARANPLGRLPAGFGLAPALNRAGLRVGLADLPDATAQQMDLLLPLSHSLESWGDAEPRAGVRTLIQPALRPLHDTRAEGEILLELLRRREGAAASAEDYRTLLHENWRSSFGPEGSERFLAQGYLAEPEAEAKVELDADAAAGFLKEVKLDPGLTGPLAALVPSIRAYDGRSRVIPLLSEVPDPLTTVSWGGWVSLAPEDARSLGVKDRDEVRLSVSSGWSATLPVRIQPGLAAGMPVVQRDVLPEAPLTVDPQTGEAWAFLAGLRLERTGRREKLPILAGSTSQEGRGIVPDPVHREEKKRGERASLYPQHEHPVHRWAMAVDLSLCIGCAACAAACYVENNVPVAGPADHLRGREMSWLRIEPFYDGTGRPEFVPMLCQHCHNAPCEPVCPVYAAYHNPEGLNIQVYNRCVGTRYCSNNCPYKVRRFNWWTHKRQAPLDRMLNPDLTVRTKGVMEKCTFCIQRIRAAEDLAKDERRALRDGEFTTACAQSCPTGAIVFGDMNLADSRIARLAGSDRAYRVFAELGTEPSVFYLKRNVTSDA